MGIFNSLENSPRRFKSALAQLGAAVLSSRSQRSHGDRQPGRIRAQSSAKLEQAGLGGQVKSWIGNGQNLPISADQLRQVLGNDTIRATGCEIQHPDRPVTSEVLAHQLPVAVDHASPHWQTSAYGIASEKPVPNDWRGRAKFGVLPASLLKKPASLRVCHLPWTWLAKDAECRVL